MRIFLLLALAFALISISLVVSQNPGFLRHTQQLVSGSNKATPAAGLTDNSPAKWSDLFEHTSFVGMQDSGWQALSGFPSFAKIIIPLPRKVTLTEGRLRLSLSTQMAESGVGTLRVSVNKTRRADLVLKIGEDRRILLLGLTPEDLGRPRLVVSLTVQGDAFWAFARAGRAAALLSMFCPKAALNWLILKRFQILWTSGWQMQNQPGFTCRQAMALSSAPTVSCWLRV
ncbi:hypothetical protein [Pararhizobium sp. IMCC21322]|uniref:hypothetical protein n=1 Tax=Pararhizobium sp. IMCC21322 TaxID=3067903 RepID=UPI0027418F11|nr:hypothetical protein [Pararhizobium sp. IMCC21322]